MDQLYAQTTQPSAPAPAAKTAPASPLGNFSIFLPALIIFALFYLLVHNPSKKEQQKREDALKSIQRGDRVLTRGGIYGTVTDIKENILILKISENNKVEVDRGYIETVQKQS